MKKIIWIIVLLLVVSGIYYWANNRSGKVETEPLSETNTLTQNEVPADWKTYRSDKYGFELMYPSTHTPYMRVENDQLVAADPSSYVVTIAENEAQAICCEPYTLSIQSDNTVGLELQDPQLEPITLDGRDALVVIGEGNLGSVYKKIYVENPAGIWIKIVQSAESDFLDQVLSTFKFTS
jgi:hypothetical protein